MEAPPRVSSLVGLQSKTGDYDASVFFALSLEKAIFRPGIVTYANIRTAEFLRPGAEIESWMRVVEAMAPASRT